MITDETVEKVREAADITAIIGEHVKLKKVGNSWRGPCPFHQGTHPNFSVVPSKGLYICFVCGEKGDVFTFLQKQLGIDFPSAVKQVAERVGIIVEETRQRREGPDPRQPLWDANSAVADYFRTQLWGEKEGEEARNYLALRRVSREVADRFGLGYAPRDPAAMRGHLNKIGMSDEVLLTAGLLVRREENGELRPRFRSRLMFPILDASSNSVGFGGRLLGPGEPKYLNSAESPVYSKSKLLYGLNMAKHQVRKDDRVMVVEGYFDVVRLVSAGFDWVVAPLGTALTDDQAKLLKKYAKNAFLLYDSDRAGQKATFRSGDQLLRHGMAVHVVTLPDGEDPDSFVDKFGREALSKQLRDSIDIFERKIQLLQRDGWFADLSRKRRALDRLLPTIRATFDPLTRDIYLSRASEAAGVAKDVLEREVALLPSGAPEEEGRAQSGTSSVAQTLQPYTRSGGSRSARAEQPRSTKEFQLMRVLVQDRSFLEEAGEQLDPERLRNPAYQGIYASLIEAPLSRDDLEIAGTLPADLGEAFQALLSPPLGDAFDKHAEVQGILRQFKADELREQLERLRRELAIAGDAEKNQILMEIAHRASELRALEGGARGYRTLLSRRSN